MFTHAKLVLQSYKPLKLEKGMWFLAVHHGQVSIYELGYNIHSNEQMETYVQLNGCPVEPYLYVVGNPNIPDETFVIATPEQIGWFDEDEESDEMHDITIKEINNILDNDGWCEIEVEEEHLDDDEAQEDYINITPVLLENKVTIRYILEDDYEEEDEEENDDEEDKEFDPADYYCDMCRGTGEGSYDGARCSFCKGSGMNYKGGDDNDDYDDKDYYYYSNYDY